MIQELLKATYVDNGSPGQVPVQLLWMVAAKLQMNHLVALQARNDAMFLKLPEGETSLLGLSGDPVMPSFTSFSSAAIN